MHAYTLDALQAIPAEERTPLQRAIIRRRARERISGPSPFQRCAHEEPPLLRPPRRAGPLPMPEARAAFDRGALRQWCASRGRNFDEVILHVINHP